MFSRLRPFPPPPAWPARLRATFPCHLSQITTNSRKFTRSFLVDPNFLIGTNVLPFTQVNNLMVGQPVSARVMIASTLGWSNPPNATGGALTAATFDNLWHAPVNTKPSDSTWSNWNGNGRDVIIQRISLKPLFYNLILNTQDTNNTATFSINTTNTTAVPANGTGWNSYYLSGSVVGLCSNGVVQTRYVLNRNISFVFANGAWSGQITPTLSATNAFSTVASNFFGSAWNSGSKFGGDQSTVLSAMANLMLDYTLCANQIPAFNTEGTRGIYQMLNLEATFLDKASGSGSGDANNPAGLLQ